MDTTRIGMSVSDEAIKKNTEKKQPKKVVEKVKKTEGKTTKKKEDEDAE